MAQGELEFVIKARDEVTQILNRLEGQVARTARTTSAEFDKASKSTSNFTGFIRQQRQEQRLQTFLFREGAQAIGAASAALTIFGIASDGASEKQKQFNAALNQGFIAFQGINFALVGLNPIIGLTAAAVGGLAIAWATMAKETKKAADMSGFMEVELDRLRELSVQALRAELALVDTQMAKTTAELERLRKKSQEVQQQNQVPARQGRGGEAPSSFAPNIGGKEAIDNAKEINRLQEENARNGKLRKEIAALLVPAEREVTKELKKQADQQEQIRLKLLQEYLLRQKMLREFKQTPEPKALPLVRGVGGLGNVDEIIDRDTTIQLIQSLETLGTTAQNVNSLIVGSVQGAAAAMTDAFFGATKSIEEFFLQMARNIVNILIEELLKSVVLKIIFSLLNFALPGLGGAAGTVVESVPGVSRTATRGAPNSPGFVGGAAPRGRQTVVVVNGGEGFSERERIMRTVNAAIFTDKYSYV